MGLIAWLNGEPSKKVLRQIDISIDTYRRNRAFWDIIIAEHKCGESWRQQVERASVAKIPSNYQTRFFETVPASCAHCAEIILPDMRDPGDEVREMLDWAKIRTSSEMQWRWKCEYQRANSPQGQIMKPELQLRFYFGEAQDAVQFKLRWG